MFISLKKYKVYTFIFLETITLSSVLCTLKFFLENRTKWIRKADKEISPSSYEVSVWIPRNLSHLVELQATSAAKWLHDKYEEHPSS